MSTEVAQEAFKDPQFVKEVSGWLDNRASDADRTGYGKIFGELQRRADALKPPPDQHASFINATLKKIQHTNTAKPPLPPQSGGWNYTSTMTVKPRPGSTGLSPTNFQRPATAAAGGGQYQRSRSTDSLAQATQNAAAAAAASLSSEINNVKSRNRPNSAPGSSYGNMFSNRSTPAVGHRKGAPNIASDVSTNQFTYGLQEIYPELYKQACDATRSVPAENQLFRSEWADTLKAGNDEAWKQYLTTTYTRYNKEVHNKEMDRLQARDEVALGDWTLKQQLYYGDMLGPELVPHVEAMMKEGAPHEKRELVETLRGVYSVVQPHKWRSHSQTVHRKLGNPNDPEIMALIKETNRLKNMGRPHLTPKNKTRSASTGRDLRPYSAPAARTVNGRDPAVVAAEKRAAELAGVTVSATSSAANSRAGSAATGVRVAPNRPASAPKAAATSTSVYKGNKHSFSVDPIEKDTFKSKVPLQWAGSNLYPKSTTYEDAHGSLKPELARNLTDATQVAGYRPIEATCPIGAVNPHTAVKPFPTAYPIPESYIRGNGEYPAKGNLVGATTNQLNFAPRDERDVVRSLKAAKEMVESSHKALVKSTIPLGGKGINTAPADGIFHTNYRDEYVPHEIRIKEDNDRRDALKAMWMGPTATVGAVVQATLNHHRPPPPMDARPSSAGPPSTSPQQ